MKLQPLTSLVRLTPISTRLLQPVGFFIKLNKMPVQKQFRDLENQNHFFELIIKDDTLNVVFFNYQNPDNIAVKLDSEDLTELINELQYIKAKLDNE